MVVDSGKTWRVGSYLVDLEASRLTRDGAAIPIPFRQFQALRLLVEARGNVVKKDEFLQRIWSGQDVDESNLTHCIAELRKTLHGGADGTTYLETVPRIGYRLAVPVEAQETVAPPERPAAPVRRWVRWAAIGAAVALGASGWILWQRYQIKAEARAFHQDGQRHRRQRDPASLSAAVEAYRKAIRLDPSNASYYASLVEALLQVPGYKTPDTQLMLEAAEKSVALDPQCTGCNSMLGFVLFTRFWNWSRAETHLKVALSGSPRASGIHGFLAMLHATQGRLDEALRHADEAIRLDPYHSTLHTIRTAVLHFSGQYTESRKAALRAVSFGQAQPSAWDWLAYSLILQRKEGEAFAEIARSGAESYPRDIHTVYLQRGLTAAVQRILETTHTLDGPERRAYRRAHWRLIGGDQAGALDELETAHRVRTFDTIYIAVDPMFEPLRDDPRFQRILRDMNLPQPVPTQSAR